MGRRRTREDITGAGAMGQSSNGHRWFRLYIGRQGSRGGGKDGVRAAGGKVEHK